MPEYERNGARLFYRTTGEGSPVLMVHSATSSGDHEWGSLVGVLADSCRCVVPDLRSHANSDHIAGDLGIGEVVDDLRALIVLADLGRPHVVGFSFGAEVALELEVQYPGSAASLVLVSPATGHSEGVPQSQKMAPRWPSSLRELHIPKHGPDHWRTILDDLSEDAAGRAHIGDKVLADLGCPMLLVSGTEDQPKRVREARRLAELNPRARLVSVEGAGHAAHAQDSRKFAAMVLDFLESAEAMTGTAPGDRLPYREEGPL